MGVAEERGNCRQDSVDKAGISAGPFQNMGVFIVIDIIIISTRMLPRMLSKSIEYSKSLIMWVLCM